MYKKKYLASAIALAMLAQGGVAIAAEQDGATDEVETIEVTGIRSSLNKALSVKRTETQIVDAIVAEDIGKFPDNNVVEALQRVTGVQTTGRGGGEVSTVTIRGLNDVHTTVNGRNVFTGNGRAVALQDIPASLLSGVNVYKTRSAAQVETGIAGSIDITTHRPFNFEGAKLVAAGRGVYADQPKELNPNMSVLASNRWDLGRWGEFGALVNVSYVETDYRDDSLTAGAAFPIDPETMTVLGEWPKGLENGMDYSAGAVHTVDGVDYPYILTRDAVFGRVTEGHRERPAANISLQWAPNDDVEYVAEAFYTGYRNQSNVGMWFTNIDAHLGPELEPTLIDGTNIIDTRQSMNGPAFQSGDASTGKTDSYLFALGMKWHVTDSLDIETEVVYQDSEYSTDFFAQRYDRTYYGLDVDVNDRNSGTPAITMWDDPDTPLDESDMTEIGNWNAGTIYNNSGGNSGDGLAYTLDGEWYVDGEYIQKVQFGGRYEKRTAQSFKSENSQSIENTSVTELISILEANGVENASDIAFIPKDYMFDRANIFDSFVVANGYFMLDNQQAIRDAYGLTKKAEYVEYDIEETGIALYATTNYFLTDDISGEIGLRYVKYEQDMNFWTVDGEYSDGKNDTSKLLPSFVLKWNIADDLLARFAYTQTLRMPNFGDLNSNISWYPPLTASVTSGTGSGGNPGLQPTESTNYDLSLEWYFAEGSSLYGAVFRRDIEGLVMPGRYITQWFEEPYEETGALIDYAVSAPVNASDGELTGLEIGLVYFPENLPGYLDGLGTQISYSYLDSSQQTPEYNDDGTISRIFDTNMAGVSDSSYSIVIAYDREVFDMRLSYVWREAFYTSNESASFANPLQFWSTPERDLTFSIGYDVTENLSVTFDATNLLDDRYQNYYGEGNQDIFNFNTSILSRSFGLGIRYSM